MNPTNEKHAALLAVRAMLCNNPLPESRHIALELRRCLEAVVYEKILAYGDRIPLNVKKTWQPPQAFKALLLFEPNADKTKVVRYARQSNPGVASQGSFKKLGTDRRPSTRWLTTTYNKLGHYLHAKWPFETKVEKATDAAQKYLRDEKYFREVEAHLTRLVDCQFTSTFAQVIEFVCTECDSTIALNAKALEKLNEVACQNRDCGCSYFVIKDYDKFHFELDAHSAECTECQEQIQIPTVKLNTGYKFVCKKCQIHFQVTEPAWEFEKIKS